MGALLHHSIDDSARKWPERESFRFDGRGLSYCELVDRANRLAQLLLAQGVRPGDRVGIYMNKGLELPVAVYGILKAGAAYVPIDAGAPSTRVQYIVDDCGIEHLITNSSRSRKALRLASQSSRLNSVIGVAVDDAAHVGVRSLPWESLGDRPAEDPGAAVGERDLAYIIYTSGSTGEPKGLMHSHASGLSYARMSAREYGVTPDDRLGNHSPLHFDMSTFEFLTGPLCGATTVMVPEEATMFPLSLAELIERERLTFWYSVPLALIQLLERGGIEKRDLSSLRWVLFGGESFPPKHLARLVELWPQARFSNSYGPAEVNQCTAYHVPPGPVDTSEAVPIGPVWRGAEGRIVDTLDREVKSGEVGELLICAPTMMLGYWGRADLDRQAFYRQRVEGDDDKVFYRTGDLVRERPDGNLVFLGRRDRQVKVRGYRVELEGIESVLSAQPGVAEAGVVAVPDASGTVELVAAVLAREGAEVDGGELRRRLARQLPAYAVPARVEVRASLGRTTSGKIDRRVLERELARRSRASESGAIS